MAQMEDKFRKQLEVAKLKLDEIEEILASGNAEDVSGAYEQIGELIKHLEKSKDVTADYLMETDKDLEYIKQWTMDHKEDISPFRNIRAQIKDKMEEIAHKETELELVYSTQGEQRADKAQMHQQKEIEQAIFLQNQREEEWYSKKLEFEKLQLQRMEEAKAGKNTTAPQAVKLQKYTITPFSGDDKDWLRFWNQFTVEVDGSGISEISKFNYLLELVKGKLKEDILGLPHTEDGYGEAKRILE